MINTYIRHVPYTQRFSERHYMQIAINTGNMATRQTIRGTILEVLPVW